MAKKEKADSRRSTLERLEKNRFSAKSLMGVERDVLSVSPILDDLLGGGFTTGSLALVVGPPKIGKTSLVLHFCRKAYNKGYRIVYLNIEGRLTERDIKSYFSDEEAESVIVYMSTPEYRLSGEEFIGIGEAELTLHRKTIVIFDSFSQLISAGSIESDMTEQTRDSITLTISKFCKRVIPSLLMNQNMCIGINHEVTNTSGYGSYSSETSGKKVQYAQDFKLVGKFKEMWYEDGVDKKDQASTKAIGQITTWKCENTALGIRGRSADSYLRYNYGIDEEYELIPTADTLGVITKTGTWFNIEGNKIQGVSNAVEFLRENPEIFQRIKEEVAYRLGS